MNMFGGSAERIPKPTPGEEYADPNDRSTWGLVEKGSKKSAKELVEEVWDQYKSVIRAKNLNPEKAALIKKEALAEAAAFENMRSKGIEVSDPEIKDAVRRKIKSML